MKIKLRFYNDSNGVVTKLDHDLSIISIIPKVGDEVIDALGDISFMGIVQRRTFDYVRNFVVIYINI